MRHKVAVLFVGHGSRRSGFAHSMKKVAAALRRDRRLSWVDCAYLEVTRPSIEEGINRLVKKGATEIRVLPYFLLTGNHVIFDIPGIVKKARRNHRSKAKIKLCPYLGYHDKIVSVVKERIGQAR